MPGRVLSLLISIVEDNPVAYLMANAHVLTRVIALGIGVAVVRVGFSVHNDVPVSLGGFFHVLYS